MTTIMIHRARIGSFNNWLKGTKIKNKTHKYKCIQYSKSYDYKPSEIWSILNLVLVFYFVAYLASLNYTNFGNIKNAFYNLIKITNVKIHMKIFWISLYRCYNIYHSNIASIRNKQNLETHIGPYITSPVFVIYTIQKWLQ